MLKLNQNIRALALVLCMLLVNGGSNIASGSTGEMTSEVSASRITLDEQVILRVSVVYPYSNSEKSPRLVPMEDFLSQRNPYFLFLPDTLNFI